MEHLLILSEEEYAELKDNKEIESILDTSFYLFIQPNMACKDDDYMCDFCQLNGEGKHKVIESSNGKNFVIPKNLARRLCRKSRHWSK